MLIQFTVGNFLSFKDKVTLSMVASKYQDKKEHLFNTGKKIKLLKSAVIYGANASGKSNLIKAMKFYRYLILSSTKGSIESRLNVNSFKLSVETENKPSFFESIFIIDNIIYRYGFEVKPEAITKEWLYYSRREKEYLLFERKGKKIIINNKSFKEGVNLDDKKRKNSLFISVVAQFNGKISNNIIRWISNFNIISGLNDFSLFTSKLLEREEIKSGVIKLIKAADLFIENIEIKEETFEDNSITLPKTHRVKILPNGKLKLVTFATSHKKYKGKKVIGETYFDMDLDESEGTKKYFSLTGPIFDTLLNGKILAIDELDSRLHPMLLIYLVRLFNSKANSKGAQFIFVSHDSTLLNQKYLRRDQVWFTDKDKYQSTKLYSLDDFKIRNDFNLENNYLLGKFGGIPIINDTNEYDEIFKVNKKSKK